MAFLVQSCYALTMSVMFEVYYHKPRDLAHEASLTSQVEALGGRLDYWEESGITGGESFCLTYEFQEWSRADRAVEILRQQGERVEGPSEYGP
jgi:hypothetical protein